MNPVRTRSTDLNFGPPPGQEDQIGNLPYFLEEQQTGKYVISVWEPSDAERRGIAAGQNIRLAVGWIGAFPPVSVGVTHQQAIE